MLTGSELAILSGIKPVIERAAGTALGKVLVVPVGVLQDRLRNRATRRQLQSDDSATSSAAEPTTEFSRALSDYLESSEFSSLAMSVAVHEFAEVRKKNQIDGLRTAKTNLRDSIQILAGAADVDCGVITDELWRSLRDAVVEHADQVRAAKELPPESRAAVVRMAANFARADMRRSEFLGNVDRLAAYHDFEESFKEQVRSLHATMRLPHAGTTRRVAYSRLFVEPTFNVPDRAQQDQYTDRKASLEGVIRDSHRTVILGDPGGGKSTLSLKLIFDIARRASRASSARVPFLVILRDYTKDFEAGKTTMLQYLENLCKSPYNMEPASGFVEYALTAGRAFVIFDGLDELIDTSLRRKVVELVESFACKYPMVPILVTTRKVGYEEAPLDENLFNAVQLAQLDDQGVQSYADKWFALDSSVEKNRREELAASFYQDSRFVADLTRNPLMLSLMCGIYASENYIPANRPEVYKKCAELLFDKWDKQRGIVTPLPFDAHVKHAINSLAYSIYSNPERQSGLTRDQLIDFVKKFLLVKRFEDEDEAEDAASQFVDFCTGRSWVLSNVGSDTAQELYGFTHRTFLEYFAANQLVRLNPTSPQLFSKLEEKISHSEWDVVSQLALQIVGNNTENGIDDFLERTLGAASSHSMEGQNNLVAFAARALAFAVPKPQLVRDICQATVELALNMVDPASEYSPTFFLRGIRSLLHANSENLPTVSRNLRYELTAANHGEPLDDPRREIRLALALSTTLIPHSGIDDSSYMDGKTVEHWERFESESFDIFESEIRSLAETKKWVAAAGATAGILPMKDVVRRFGPEALFQFHVGPLVLRAPVVLRIPGGVGSQGRFRYDSALRDCLAQLSEILPEYPTPWFTERYDYKPLGTVGGYGSVFRWNLSQVPEDHRDALILLAAAWCELAGEDKKWPTKDARSDTRIRRLALKWNSARLNSDYHASALRSIKACQLKAATINLLVKWVEGEVQFVQMPAGPDAASD
ncbi:NACHT domain-containing protein [Streptomyces sp. NPDC002814]